MVSDVLRAFDLVLGGTKGHSMLYFNVRGIKMDHIWPENHSQTKWRAKEEERPNGVRLKEIRASAGVDRHKWSHFKTSSPDVSHRERRTP